MARDQKLGFGGRLSRGCGLHFFLDRGSLPFEQNGPKEDIDARLPKTAGFPGFTKLASEGQ